MKGWARQAPVLAALLLALPLSASARPTGSTPTTTVAVDGSDQASRQLAQRLFPALTALDPSRLPASTRAGLAERARLRSACNGDAPCVVTASRWSGEQIAALSAAAGSEKADAVAHELSGLNIILAEYAQGRPPLYPEIDGPRGVAGSARQARDVRTAVELATLDAHAGYTALDASIALAVALLDANDRLEAIQFQPLDAGLNAAAFQRAQALDWERWPHSALIVLGSGPADDQPLSAISKLRVRLAAHLYAAGQAPYIIVSGGAVHPRGTRTVEAVEMRRALLERYGVPADAVIIEPHARHTTTNVRNAARLLLALRAPATRDALVVSSADHIDYVAGPRFIQRLHDELGQVPGQIGARVSANAVAFRPAATALQRNPADPLDP